MPGSATTLALEPQGATPRRSTREKKPFRPSEPPQKSVDCATPNSLARNESRRRSRKEKRRGKRIRKRRPRPPKHQLQATLTHVPHLSPIVYQAFLDCPPPLIATPTFRLWTDVPQRTPSPDFPTFAGNFLCRVAAPAPPPVTHKQTANGELPPRQAQPIPIHQVRFPHRQVTGTTLLSLEVAVPSQYFSLLLPPVSPTNHRYPRHFGAPPVRPPLRRHSLP